MAPGTKKQCVNNPEYTYTGNESSPLGLGYVAEAEQPGSIMKGKDGTNWMVGKKNGVNVWNRVPIELIKEDHLITKDDEQAKPEKTKQEAVASDNNIISVAATKKKAPARKAKVVKDSVSIETTVVVESNATDSKIESKKEEAAEVAEVAEAEPLKEVKKKAPVRKPRTKKVVEEATEELTPAVVAATEPETKAEPEVEADATTEVKKKAPARKPRAKKVVEEAAPVVETAPVEPAQEVEPVVVKKAPVRKAKAKTAA